MLLSEIEEITSSDEKFKQYVEGDGEGGQTALTLDLIIKATEVDGASLADFELLGIIADISDLFKHYEARRGE
jgi:hypothetical protein